MTVVQLDRIGKTYGSFKAVEAFDLTIEDGEFLVLLGPSGCGKSTTLRMIAGLESISTGALTIGGAPMNDVEPKDRGVAMVFQNDALYPHKTVFDNMAMALKLQKVSKDEIEQRVGDTAEMLGLTDYLAGKPAALFGGQRQRLAIGRAIARTPKVFLFDEPLSNLDAKLRGKMRMDLRELHDRLGVTSIQVTHDQIEAMTLADRIVIMNDGVVAQVGSPREVYDTPADEFVAGFIGSPSMNFVDLRASENGGWVSVDGHLALPPLPFETGSRTEIRLGLRPEHLEIDAGADGNAETLAFAAKVQLAELLGADALLNIDIEGVRLLARVSGTDHPLAGDQIRIQIRTAQLRAFDRQTGRALKHEIASPVS